MGRVGLPVHERKGGISHRKATHTQTHTHAVIPFPLHLSRPFQIFPALEIKWHELAHDSAKSPWMQGMSHRERAWSVGTVGMVLHVGGPHAARRGGCMRIQKRRHAVAHHHGIWRRARTPAAGAALSSRASRVKRWIFQPVRKAAMERSAVP